MKKNHNTNSEIVGERAKIFLRGDTWCVNLQISGKQIRRSLKTKNKKEARAKAIQFERELQSTGGRSLTPLDRITIEESADELMQCCEVEGRSPKTITKYRQVLNRVIAFAATRTIEYVDEMNLYFIDQFRRHRNREGAKPKTIHTEVGVIRRLVLYAKSRRLIAEDPLEGLRLSEPKSAPQPCWSPEEVELILEQASPAHRNVFTFLAETGMRIGELRWLTWDDVDLKKRTVSIRPKDDWKTKTGNVRTIPLSDRAARALAEQPRGYRWVFTARASPKYPDGGHQISDRRLLESLKRTLKKVGLQGHLHTFRHSFISRAIVSGIPEAVIRAWVGHVDHQTLQHYTHIAEQQSQQAMAYLEKMART